MTNISPQKKIWTIFVSTLFIGGFLYGAIKSFTSLPEAPLTQKNSVPDYQPVEILANAKKAYQDKEFEKVLEYTKLIEAEHKYRLESKKLRGNAYRKLKKPDLALNEYTEALIYAGNKAELYQLIAMSYFDLKKYADSENFFLKAIEEDPENFEIRENLGTFYYNRKDLDKSKKIFADMLKIQENYSEAHKRIGIIYQAQGKKDLAIKHLERYIELRPKAMNIEQVKKLLADLKSS